MILIREMWLHYYSVSVGENKQVAIDTDADTANVYHHQCGVQ